MTRHTIASAPAGEAASATRHACTTPSRRDNYPLQNSAPLDRWATAASRLSSTLRDRVASWLREVFGEVEFSESVLRRGHMGPEALCRVCRKDVCNNGQMCPEQLIADCSAHGHEVLLDYYLRHEGQGPTCRPQNVRPATEWQWRSLVREQREKRRLRYRR